MAHGPPQTTDPAANSTFTITIAGRTPAGVARVLDDLVAKAQEAQGQELSDTLTLMAQFGRLERA